MHLPFGSCLWWREKIIDGDRLNKVTPPRYIDLAVVIAWTRASPPISVLTSSTDCLESLAIQVDRNSNRSGVVGSSRTGSIVAVAVE
jgi:hypothetical protein